MADSAGQDRVVSIARGLNGGLQTGSRRAPHSVLLEALVDVAGEAIHTKSLDGTVLTWNRAAARLTGLEPAEVIGRSHALFRSPVEVQRIEAAMAQLAAGADSIAIAGTMLRRDGSSVDVDTTLSAIRGRSGELLAVGVVARSAEARRDADEARARIDALYEIAPVAMMELDPGTLRLLRANRRLCALCGLSQDELTASTLFELVAAGDRARLREAVAAFRSGSREAFTLDTWLCTDYGASRDAVSGRPVTVTLKPVVCESGGLFGLTAAVTTERAFPADERRLARVIDNASIALVERDIRTQRFTRVNAAFCGMVGYSERELLAKTLDELTPANELAAVRGRVERLVAGEMTEYTALKPLLCADGSLCWVLGTISLLRGEHGDPDSLITAYINVTEAVAARARLEASEERYRRLVDTMPDAVAILDTVGETRFVNRAAVSLLGYPEQHWRDGGQPAVSAALDADGVEAQRRFWAAFEENGEFDETPFELAWMRRDGRRITLEHRIANLRDDQDKVTGVLVVQRDVTGERLARIERERVAAIVEASEDAIFSVSRAHVVESWNSGCARLFALRPWLALLRPLDSLFPRQDCEALAAMIDRTIAGETVRNVDWPFADGRTGPAAAAGSGSAPSGTSPAAHWTVSMRPIQGRGGEVCSVAVIVRDVTSERAATAALDEERRFVRAVLDTLPIGVSVRDVLGQVLLANTRFDDLHAQGRPSAVGTSYADRVRDPAEIDLLMRTDREVLRTGRPAEYERRITAADGSVRDVQVMKMPIRVAGELRILAASVDITARRRAESELQREREFMRTEIDTDPTLIYVRDASGRFLLANRAVAASLGFRVSAVEGQRLADLLADPVRSAEYSTHDAEMLRLRRPITREECHRDASGNERWFSSTRLPLTGADGAVVVLGVSTEVTEIRRQAQRIHELTHYDPLTGLPNRLLIEDLLQVALARAERDRAPVAVMFVDLDHFKTVNDSLGHPVGDRLLVAVSDRMRAALRDVDSIGRLGGDEFLIVLAQIERGDAVALVAQKLLKVLEESFDVQGHSLSVNASIGIAMYPDDGTTPHVLVQNADTAMYHAKEQGRAGYRFFTQELNARAARSLAIEHGIRRGLREGEFELWYQPVHATADGTVAAMEALIRWRRSSGDLWGPGEFIGVAEERGQIVHLGRWVLRAACAFVAGRRAAGLAPIPVAINLSPAELRQPGLVGQVARALDEFGLPPSAIEFEVTENSIMHDIGAAIEVLRGLRALGVVVAVDDFGTGHSSLAWLRQLPIDKLKIDRAFVANVPASEPDAAIFAAIVTMARALGIRTVAEGIETPAQFERVRALGCDLAQGYLLSRPLPEAQVSARVDTGARPPAARLP